MHDGTSWGFKMAHSLNRFSFVIVAAGFALTLSSTAQTEPQPENQPTPSVTQTPSTQTTPSRTVTRTYTRTVRTVLPSGQPQTTQPSTQQRTVVTRQPTVTTSPQPQTRTYRTTQQPSQIQRAPAPSPRPTPVQRSTTSSTRPATRTQRATTSGVLDAQATSQLLWSTMHLIGTAQNTGDYGALRASLSPRLQRETTAEMMSAQFGILKQGQMDLGRTVGRQPAFELAPHRIEDGRMRIRGTFNIDPMPIRFDLLYAPVGSSWRLDAIAFAEGN